MASIKQLQKFLLVFLSAIQIEIIYSLNYYDPVLNKIMFQKPKPPKSKYFQGVKKLTNFIGAKDLRFSAMANKLLFTSDYVFGPYNSCNQLYVLKLDLSTLGNNGKVEEAAAAIPQRITFTADNVGHVESMVSRSNGSEIESIVFTSSGDSILMDNWTTAEQNDWQQKCNENNEQWNFINWIREKCNDRNGNLEMKNYCKNWWSKERKYGYAKNELIGWLDPKSDIFVAEIDENNSKKNILNPSSIRKLTEETNFDGFPAMCRRNDNATKTKRIFYISSQQPSNNNGNGNVPQLWQMDWPNGENKKQLTFSNEIWKIGPINLSPDCKKLVFVCISSPNGGIAKIISNSFGVNKINNFYNASSQRICTMDLLSEKFQILEFYQKEEDDKRNGQSLVLYQYSNPIFISNQKIFFTARKSNNDAKNNNATENGIETEDTPYSNSALFVSDDIDGTQLEQVVDYRSKNDYAAFDPQTGFIAWVTTDTVSKEFQFLNHIYIARLKNSLWHERKADGTNAEEESKNLTFIIDDIFQLTNVSQNQYAIRPKFSFGGESLHYELVTINPENLQIEASQIIRISMREGSQNTQQWLVSPPHEIASGVANLDPFGDMLAYSIQNKKKISKNESLLCKKMKQKQPNFDVLERVDEEMDIYKFNAFGHPIHPIVRRKGFDGYLTMHARNKSDCQMVFVSTEQKGNKNLSGTKSSTDLWTLNYCECSGGVYNTKTMLDDGCLLRILFHRDGLLSMEPSFSQDGNKLVFVGNASSSRQHVNGNCEHSRNFDSTELFTVNANGTELRQITQLERRSRTPKFLPNDDQPQRIIFSSDYGNDFVNNNIGTGLFIVDLESPNRVHFINSTFGEAFSVNKFPDVFKKIEAFDEYLIVWSHTPIDKMLTMNLFTGTLKIKHN